MKVTILFLKLGHLYMPIKIPQDGVCLLKLYYRLTEYHEFRGHLTEDKNIFIGSNGSRYFYRCFQFAFKMLMEMKFNSFH